MSHKQGEKAVRTLEAKDYTVRIREMGDTLFLAYTPETAKIGGYFVLELEKVAISLKLKCTNIAGLGSARATFKKTEQVWEIRPIPDETVIIQLKRAIEFLLKRDIVVNNLLN